MFKQPDLLHPTNTIPPCTHTPCPQTGTQLQLTIARPHQALFIIHQNSPQFHRLKAIKMYKLYTVYAVCKICTGSPQKIGFYLIAWATEKRIKADLIIID